jgi:hypothetical protein
VVDVAGLLLGIGALFPVCIQGYRALASIQRFRKESLALYWKFKTQELQFTTWGQAYGFQAEDLGYGFT